jgi:hypothetical protein
MYVFSRQMVLRGDQRRFIPWATETSALVRKLTGLDVLLWRATLGAPVVTLRATVRVQTRAEITAALRSLGSDDAYLEQDAAGQEYMAEPPVHNLVEVLHTARGPLAPPEIGSAASLISAEIVPGQYGPAITWGVEVSELVAEITGIPVSFQRNVAGPFGGVHWLQVAPDADAQATADDKLAADDRYLIKLSEIGEMFVETSGQRILGARIA